MSKEEVKNLDIFEKFNIWFHYYITHLGLVHNFYIRDTLTDTSDKGWGTPDKVYGNIEIRYLWKDLKYVKFEDFTDERLWEWYQRFKEEFKSKQR